MNATSPTGDNPTRPAIFVGPNAPEALVRAVESAGGDLTSPQAASAIVWYGAPATDLSSYLHPNVRWVQLPSAGIESYIAAGVVNGDRTYTSAAGSYSHTVAEHALALMLAASRRLHDLARTQTWTEPTSGTLHKARVVIVGAGGIGQALIRLLEPIGPEVVAITRSGRPVEGASLSATPDKLPDLLPDAEFVVLAAPATSDTTAIIGARELGAMASSSWLVNVGRGSLVDTDALVEALRTHSIGGAALEVTDPEPLPDGHPLWSRPNVLITPHSSNPLSLRLPNLINRVYENVVHFSRDEPLVGVVDISAGY